MNVLLSLAIENRPKMRRVCLNRKDSIVDILWFRPTDNCNSFTNFKVYGRDNVLNFFQLYGTYTDYSLDHVNFKLPNILGSWTFFLIYNQTCNGLDSVYSDTISVDFSPPANSQIDSVSVDILTQKTIIGWRKNTDNDVRGYFIYHFDEPNNKNIIISNTTATAYTDLNNTRDPAQSSYQFEIAAEDSCRNASGISDPHGTIFLQSSIDECTQKITLKWNRYKGWAEQAYEIYLKTNAGFKLINTVFDPNISGFTYDFPSFGVNYCFFVRAIKVGGLVSSSSNISCASSSTIIPAKLSYIAKASIQNNNVELTLVTQNGTSLKQVNIYKAEENNPFSIWKTIATSGGTLDIIDNNVNVQSKYYRYFFNTEGPCMIFDSSQIAKTILLNVNMNSPGNQQLNWNLYDNFIKLTQNQEILLSDNSSYNRGSPWNIISTISNTTKIASDFTTFGANQEKICYCIRAIENQPTQQYKRQDTSYSNIQCVTADPIVYFPNAIQLNGYNTIFAPEGVFIDSTKSSFVIYNRWGEMIYETNKIFLGWDGTENNAAIQSDVYAYKATIVGINGKTLYFDGTITVLK